ncbi:ShlB/FhaC/HecB family hemolysin secretion/activation protein [Candidatus Omnitrophota bacterium]
MKRNSITRLSLLLVILITILSSNLSIAEGQQIPPGQDVGATGRRAEKTKRATEVTQELIKEAEEPKINTEDVIEPEKPKQISASQERQLIDKIEVTGVSVVDDSIIRAIVEPYEGKELSLDEFRNIADAISDEYRSRGYVTSFAYLPPQRIDDSTLRIEVLEGKVGGITLEGNKHFKKRVLLKYITQKKDDIFNYDVLRRDIDNLNSHPDRAAKAVLARGEERGQTDLNLQVKDKTPLHATLGYDNYNSRYLDRNRFLVELKSNNLTGNDDIASAEVQFGEEDKYQLYSARYLYPIIPTGAWGAYYIHVDQKLGREVSSLNIEGDGDIISTYYAYKVADKDNFSLDITPGFEYKDIENTVLGITTGDDKIRIAKVGLNLDANDRFDGRTIITQEFDFGIEDILGGLDHKDPDASRLGAGGRFFRSVTNIARIQTLPKSMALMLKGAMQLTAYNMVSSEQFTIGGINRVRGYPVAEYAGDRGGTLSAELYIPPYGTPKEWKVPFTKDVYWFDALRFVGFFDWGIIENKSPQVGEPKKERLYSAGPALRLDIPNKASLSLDLGIQLGQEASDGSDSRFLAEVKLFF